VDRIGERIGRIFDQICADRLVDIGVTEARPSVGRHNLASYRHDHLTLRALDRGIERLPTSAVALQQLDVIPRLHAEDCVDAPGHHLLEPGLLLILTCALWAHSYTRGVRELAFPIALVVARVLAIDPRAA